jgi:hypothetical protein
MLTDIFIKKADPGAQRTVGYIYEKERAAIIYLIPVSGQHKEVREAIAEVGAREFQALSDAIYIAALVTNVQAQQLANCDSVDTIVNKREDQLLSANLQ